MPLQFDCIDAVVIEKNQSSTWNIVRHCIQINSGKIEQEQFLFFCKTIVI